MKADDSHPITPVHRLDAPVARQQPENIEHWGATRTDPYRWMHDRTDPAVRQHLEAENRFTESVLAPTQALRQQIFDEIKSRVQETDLSVPIVDGGWAYYSRTVEGRQYPIHCRRTAPADGSQPLAYAVDDTEGEEVLLDENLEAGDSEFFDLGLFDVSPNHRYMLWGCDRVGDERFDARIRDLETGEEIDDGLRDLGPGSAWALDNETFFYLRLDDTYRPFQVWRHRVGTPSGTDVLVYQEDDERFFVGVAREKDDSYIHIGCSSKLTDEIRLVPADDPTAKPRIVAPRREGIEYSVAHCGDRFVILTNDGATNFRVLTTPDDQPEPEHWDELIAASDTVTVSGFDVCDHYLTLFERADGSTRIRLRFWDDGRIVTIDQPETPSTVWAGANIDSASPLLRYGYTSMVTPSSLFLLNPLTGERQLLKQQEVLGGFDPDRYRTTRIWSTSADGTRVPISVVWRQNDSDVASGAAGLDSDSGRAPRPPGPCMLYGYGAYEASMDPGFSSARLSLLDRGFAVAVVHARGGGDLGRSWYLDGKFERKQNTFTDVIGAASHLIDQGWTTAEQLVLRGGSAGGLMVGAVMNQAPDLFRAVVAEVPFVDALSTILDPSQPLTVTEWEEWGNPLENEAVFRAMLAYSPYDNLVGRSYPSVLATAGLHDSRVNYWEPAKWVQRLRELDTGPGPTLLWTELSGGHMGPSGRYEAWRDEARVLAYMCWITDAMGLVA